MSVPLAPKAPVVASASLTSVSVSGITTVAIPVRGGSGGQISSQKGSHNGRHSDSGSGSGTEASASTVTATATSTLQTSSASTAVPPPVSSASSVSHVRGTSSVRAPAPGGPVAGVGRGAGAVAGSIAVPSRTSSHLQSTLPSTSSQKDIAEAGEAVHASMANLLDTQLRDRAVLMHRNMHAIEKQQRDLDRAVSGLQKVNNEVARLVHEFTGSYKEMGHVQNWAEMQFQDILMLEETMRLVHENQKNQSSPPRSASPLASDVSSASQTAESVAIEESCPSDKGKAIQLGPAEKEADSRVSAVRTAAGTAAETVAEAESKGMSVKKGKGKEVEVPSATEPGPEHQSLDTCQTKDMDAATKGTEPDKGEPLENRIADRDFPNVPTTVQESTKMAIRLA